MLLITSRNPVRDIAGFLFKFKQPVTVGNTFFHDTGLQNAVTVANTRFLEIHLFTIKGFLPLHMMI